MLSIPDFATTVAVMLGLGVGIDYALFIVTRYRENLHKGASVEDAAVVAMDTAGRAVAFAGTTVVISLLGMVLMGLSFITGLAGRRAPSSSPSRRSHRSRCSPRCSGSRASGSR